MISGATLDRAVENGLLTREQASRLREMAAEDPSLREPEDPEKLRLVSGFSDIFVTIGLGLFLSALGYLASALSRSFHVGDMLGYATAAIVSWLLAEFFTRKRRMALPSIVLLLAFAGCSFGAMMETTWIFGLLISTYSGLFAAVMLVSALVTAGLTALHYRRFRVPITIAVGTGAVALAVIALVMAVMPDALQAYLNWFILPLGLAVFALAMHYDMSDPRRETRNTDIAFWLHMLAAPMIVHPLVYGVLGESWNMTLGKAAIILGMFVALAGVSVIVDRRAILVSGLIYAGSAFLHLTGLAGINAAGMPLTMLVLGAFVLSLSAGWRPLRRAVLSLLPPRLSARLPLPISV